MLADVVFMLLVVISTELVVVSDCLNQSAMMIDVLIEKEVEIRSEINWSGFPSKCEIMQKLPSFTFLYIFRVVGKETLTK